VVAIIGLGNPGYEYEWTRHNVGFKVVDEISEALQVELDAGRGNYLIGITEYHHKELALVKPLTYMNNSGHAVAELVERYSIRVEDLLVVCDDFHLPLGRLRLRARGSDGGHNGLYSIIYHLQTDAFPRLRCGIGRPDLIGKSFHAADFVLSVFDKEEIPRVRNMIEDARDASLSFVAEGIVAAMDRWNAPRRNLSSDTRVAMN